MTKTEIPTNFRPQFEIVSCFCEYQGKILILHRQDYKPQGNTWGVPAGKLRKGESPKEGIIREIGEETGIRVPPRKIKFFKKIYVRNSNYDFLCYMYHFSIKYLANVITREEEHKAFTWVTPSEAMTMNLIQDLDSCIKMYYCE